MFRADFLLNKGRGGQPPLENDGAGNISMRCSCTAVDASPRGDYSLFIVFVVEKNQLGEKPSPGGGVLSYDTFCTSDKACPVSSSGS